MKTKTLTKKEQAELLGGQLYSAISFEVESSATIVNKNDAPACICRFNNTSRVRNKNLQRGICHCVCI
jgi:hypothetical protein